MDKFKTAINFFLSLRISNLEHVAWDTDFCRVDRASPVEEISGRKGDVMDGID